MPCLNEAETLQACIREIQQTFIENKISGEVIVADNGSSDGSQSLAEALAGRVIHVDAKGYGSALRAGIAAAQGTFVVIGDADSSYDYTAIPAFISTLRMGFEIVVGNRFKGGIQPGAMRPLHRYLGIPILSRIARLLFKSPCGDHHCGLRAFTKKAFEEMQLRASGWEFGSEMIAKAHMLKMRIAEVPTILKPDGRSRPPHLRTWEAGWLHLQTMLLYSPRWLFFYPGVLLIFFGLSAGILLFPGPRSFGGITLNVHTLLYAATAVVLGFQSIIFAVFTKIFAIGEGIFPEDPRLDKWVKSFRLETGLFTGVLLFSLGMAGSLYAVGLWQAAHFGDVDSNRLLRIVIPSVSSLTLGGQTVLSSFFLSVLKLHRKKES